MNKLKVMQIHYIVIGGVITKLSEACIVQNDMNYDLAHDVEELRVIKESIVTRIIDQLKQNPTIVDVIKLTMSDIVNITFLWFGRYAYSGDIRYYRITSR